ncbi:tRNA-splicing endonuclease subunit SEN54 family protein [Aspergillus clavatus NRRL 1]|uniref:tRNA splicing endonuclease subunit (Sen54), putative n=1 Tax=Aspergillus clavatus (strain ATCC 1007 / CBS 513.65 / DSM 816 / NCTC 3887 / NRRL 1 / QM 1276 / 107) TaxID=344612 RepID=A1CTU3_ASPCL|nr:tRNA splicing endonuclease subunit (Sen54), putative [Aspergillus clavatus NRRL 1]EAW06730.1 tRNA splicing endonuclease subunit (Sen54), putative [Aspergillus clavatus NRRL 1]
MADMDEDAARLPSTDSSTHIEVDLSDETQDFRMLNHISFLTDPSQSSLPKRGEKDFEPNPTEFQADVLAASRRAMHNALSYPRLHHPKHKIVGVYAPDGPAPPSTATLPPVDTPTPDTKTGRPAATKLGVHPDACVYVSNPKGQYFKTMGQADRWNRVWLLPEEALYLLERGSLEIRWPFSLTGCGDEDDGGDSGIPMSLQAAYACCIGRGGLTIERFTVYTGLKRLGYTLTRAPGWYDDAEEVAVEAEKSESPQQGTGLAGVFGRFLKWLETPSPASGGIPLVGLGMHRSYSEPDPHNNGDVYRRLSIIPWYDPTMPRPPAQTTAPFRVVFHVYKPSTPFRKTAPPAPDFRIAVVDSRTHSMPTVSQLGALLESTPLDPPRGEKMDRQLYMRLRQGYRNVILAVIDQGVVSYLRVADAAFGKEKLYEGRGNPQGNKGRFTKPKPKGR